MLTIRHLSHTYPNGVEALKNVSLEMPKGLFGLLGPNGAGKSSLMRTIATLQHPSSGHINFDGIDVLKSPDHLRRTLGYLPQDFGVYPRGSAESLLNHLAVLKGFTEKAERKEIVESLLIQTNLHDHRKKRLASFSGGMRQRFGIAQALIGDPQLIIVDEPTAGLDPEERNRFHNLLSEIGEDVCVILSTHIVDDVEDLCPRIAILAGGQIVKQGTPAELIEGLSDKVWEGIQDRSNLETLKAQHNVISTKFSKGETIVRIISDARPKDDFSPASVTLEDVYFSAITSSPTVSIPAA
jgi:ABC-type multidrug transport system ATPase subunit